MQYWHVPLRVHTRVLHTDLNAPRVALLLWHLCAAAAATFPLFHPTDRPGFNSQPQCASGLAHGAKTLSSAPLPRKRIPLRATNRRAAGPDATLARRSAYLQATLRQPTQRAPLPPPRPPRAPPAPPARSRRPPRRRRSPAARTQSQAAVSRRTSHRRPSKAETTAACSDESASSNCGAFPERVCLCCNQPLCASSSHQKAASETPGACAPPARACGQALKKRAL